MNLCKQFDSLSFAFQCLIVVAIYFLFFRLFFGTGTEPAAAAATALWMVWAVAVRGVKSFRKRTTPAVQAG